MSTVSAHERAEVEAFGSRASRRVCLRYVLRHPVAFREYWAPKVYKRHVWMRYTFVPPVMAAAHGDTLLAAGRGTGKSFCVLEPEIVRRALARPGEETLVTSFRHPHVHDRMERAIDYFEDIPFFRRFFLRRVLRSPFYVELYNAHQIYGISVGDDPDARMGQGKHVSTMIVEEAHQYPMRAWMKIQGAKDPRGCRLLMIGVPDGRIDTPFRKADAAYETFEGRRFHLSRRTDPFWDQKTKRTYAETLGGESGDMFRQEIDAEWGNPVWSAWDLEAIMKCVEPGLAKVVLQVSGKDYRTLGLTPSVVCGDLPGPGRESRVRRLAMDVGYSQPSVIGVFEQWHDRWSLIARINLVNRMEHDDQAAVVAYIADLYEVERIGVDATDGEGRAICAELERLERWTNAVTRVLFQETLLSGWTPEGEEIWEQSRYVGTHQVRTGFAHRVFALPRDEDIPAEFNQEMEARGADGALRIITPPTVHITDMFRVMGVLMFHDEPPTPPEEPDGEFVLPEWGGAGPWERASV